MPIDKDSTIIERRTAPILLLILLVGMVGTSWHLYRRGEILHQ